MLDMLPPPVPANDGIRILAPEEIATLKPVFEAAHAPLPDPALSQFIGAVKNGKVVGFIVLQVKLHAEPVWVEEGHSEVFMPLVAKAEKVILERTGPQWVYLFAPAGKVTRLAQTMGMQLEPWCVLSKLVAPTSPVKQSIDALEFAPPEIPVTEEEMEQYPGIDLPTTEAIQ